VSIHNYVCGFDLIELELTGSSFSTCPSESSRKLVAATCWSRSVPVSALVVYFFVSFRVLIDGTDESSQLLCCFRAIISLVLELTTIKNARAVRFH